MRCSLNDSELCRLTRNSSHFRNELHAGQPLRSGSVAEWTLPEVLLTYPVVVFEDRRWSIGIHVVHVSKCHQISIVAFSYCFAFLHHRVLLAVQTTHGPVAHLAATSCIKILSGWWVWVGLCQFQATVDNSQIINRSTLGKIDGLGNTDRIWGRWEWSHQKDSNGAVFPCDEIVPQGQPPQISVWWRGQCSCKAWLHGLVYVSIAKHVYFEYFNIMETTNSSKIQHLTFWTFSQYLVKNKASSFPRHSQQNSLQKGMHGPTLSNKTSMFP